MSGVAEIVIREVHIVKYLWLSQRGVDFRYGLQTEKTEWDQNATLQFSSAPRPHMHAWRTQCVFVEVLSAQ